LIDPRVQTGPGFVAIPFEVGQVSTEENKETIQGQRIEVAIPFEVGQVSTYLIENENEDEELSQSLLK